MGCSIAQLSISAFREPQHSGRVRRSTACVRIGGRDTGQLRDEGGRRSLDYTPMSDLRLMWRNTRMVVLCAISAALYAAVLVPFKVVPLIPGVTELRPANAIPVVCSFLFGPAAAWGSAIGNMI